MANIVVVGAGVVGVANARAFQTHGHAVRLVDIDPERVAYLQLEGLDATTALDLSGPECFVLIALPTPSDDNGFDLTLLRSGLDAIGGALRVATARHTIVVRSTVPPHTCDQVVGPTLERSSGRLAGSDFLVAYVPEFLRHATALQDVLSPLVTVLASRQPDALGALTELFRPFGGELRTFDDPVVAEVIKLSHNAFNATKISFWNEIWKLCRELGIDAEQVSGTVARSAEGSINPNYGIRGGAPFEGDCLPKDIEGLLGVGRSLGVDLPLLSSVQVVNQTVVDDSSAIAPEGGHRTCPPNHR